MNEFVSFVNAAGRVFVGFVLPMLIQSSVLILGVLLLDRLLRRRVKAVVRYGLWMLVLVKLILPPSLASPTSLVAWIGARLPDLSDPIEAVVEAPPVAVPVASVVEMPIPMAEPVIAPLVPYQAAPPAAPEPISPAVVSAAPLGEPIPPLTWQAVAFLCWLAVVAVMLVVLIQRAAFVRTLVAQSEEPPQSMTDLLQQCRVQMKVRAPVSLRLTSLSASPSVCGLWKPRILMPQNMTKELNASQLKSILLHELAHVKRADLWISLVQALLQIVYFFHPLLWLANLMIRRVREQAVDETVLAAMGDEAEDYPRTLLNVSKLAFGKPVLSLRLIGVVESKRALTTRIKHIASRPFPKTAKLGLAGFLLVATVAAVLIPMAQATPNNEVPPAEVEQEEIREPRAIKGVVTDTLGRPRQCVYVAPQGKRVWDGVMSDVRGRFVLEDVTPDQKVWIAYSQASRLYGVARMPESSSSPLRVTLDLDRADIEGRVVGADGKALANRKVEFIVTTADGIRFPIGYRPKTDAFGYYLHGRVPCGKGVTIETRMLDAEDNPTPFSTGPVKVRAKQGFIEMPPLAAAQKKIQPDFEQNLRNDGMFHCSGRVVDEKGKPIRDARIRLSFDMPNHMSTWVKDAMTDGRGQWRRAIPPQAMDLRMGVDHPEFYVEESRSKPPRTELKNGTHVFTMKRGLALKGKVVDQQGRPIENALVCADRSYSRTPSPYNQIIENSTTARTVKDGTFNIGGLPPGSRTIAAYSDSHAPTLQNVDIQSSMEATTIVLVKGRTYRGRIVDAQGQPIEGVKLGVSRWRLGKEQRDMSRLAQTDAQGQFSLTNLPEGEIGLYFGKRPFMGFHQDLPDDLSQADEIVMYDAPVFTGRVLDAETDKPVTEFRVVNGIKWKRQDASYHWSRYRRGDIKDPNGAFSQRWGGYSISYPLSSAACIKIEAPGYLPAIAPPQELDQPCKSLTIRLRRGVSITGTVLQPNGAGAAKAQVGFIRPGEKAFIDRDQFSAAGFTYQAEIIRKADESGKFELPPTEGQGLIVAVHKSGYSQAPSAQFEIGSSMRLTPWSRIEGTIDRSQTNGAPVEVALYRLGAETDRDKPAIRWLFDRISPTGDTFAFEFVPAVPLSVGRIDRYEMNDATYLRPEPDKTYSVVVGREGRTVAGKIVCPDGLLENKSIELTDPRQTHAVAFRTDGAGAPTAGIGAFEETSFTWLWQDKERAYTPSQSVRKRFIPEIDGKGRFTFAGLEPGQYEFVVNLHAPLGENVSCGRGVLEGVAVNQFTVPKGGSSTILRIGDVQIQHLTYPGVGEPAPLFEATTFEGETIRLEDLRGKVVLLDFWASWCSPCVAQLPKVQAIYEQFGEREDFAMIGLSLDWETERAERLLAEKQLRWQQACLGSMDESTVVRQYGIGGIPMLVLIDAEGTIIARGADTEQLKQRIEDAISKTR